MTRTLTYPTKRVEDLSPDAQTLFRASTSNGRLDRDPFDPQARRRFVGREEALAYRADERVLRAAAELEAAGLGDYDPDYRALYRTFLHPLYTVARGRGAYFAQIRLVQPEYASYPEESSSPLLATLTGASWDRRDGRSGSQWATYTLQAHHRTATDFEHDTSKVATFSIANPVQESVYGGGHQKWIGTLTEARMYPFGVDPTQATDDDHPEPRTCDGKEYYGGEHEAHPFAPFTPPERPEIEALVPSIVIITLHPLVAYSVAGEPAPEEE